MPLPSNVRSTLYASAVGFIVVQVDVSIVNLALPHISAQFHAQLTELQWLVDGYAITFAAFLLVAGGLGDRLGNRRTFAAGLILFAVTSLACGLAPSVSALIFSRVVQGIGAALVLPTSLALITHACGDNDSARARAIGWWSAVGALSMAAGPLLGGLIVDQYGWRSIFLVNVPLCGLGFVMTRAYVSETLLASSTKVDWTGQVLALLALTILTASAIGGGSIGWAQTRVLAGFVSSFALGLAFVIYENRTEAPMIPFGLFRLPGYSASVLVGTVISFTFFGLIFILSLYFQHVKNYTALRSGLAFSPLTTVLLAANLAGGNMCARIGYRKAMLIGLAVGAVGYIAMAIGVRELGNFLSMVPGLTLIALGTGAAAPAMTAAALAQVEQRQAGTASAVLTTSRQMGGVFGVAVFGGLIQGRFIDGFVYACGIAGGLFAISAYVVLRSDRAARGMAEQIT